MNMEPASRSDAGSRARKELRATVANLFASSLLAQLDAAAPVMRDQVYSEITDLLGGVAAGRRRSHHEKNELRAELFKRLQKLSGLHLEADPPDTHWTNLGSSERSALLNSVVGDILGWGPIESLLDADDVEDIQINGPDDIYVLLASPTAIRQKDGSRWILVDKRLDEDESNKVYLSMTCDEGSRIQQVAQRFEDEDHLRNVTTHVLGLINRRVDEQTPLVDARWEDKRINVIIPPLSTDRWCVTIRKHPEAPMNWIDLVAHGTWDFRMAAFLALCVAGRVNMLVSGGTGAGKTTTLNVLGSFFGPDERIVTIEDTAEIQLRGRRAERDIQEVAAPSELRFVRGLHNVVSLETRLGNVEGKGEYRIRDLVRNALRMRPDRIVVGEVRGPEALDMIQAMNTGHDGSITTIHANSADDVFGRLELMILQAGVEGLDSKDVRRVISQGLDVIVHQALMPSGERRITEIVDAKAAARSGTRGGEEKADAEGEKGKTRTHLLFQWEERNRSFISYRDNIRRFLDRDKIAKNLSRYARWPDLPDGDKLLSFVATRKSEMALLQLEKQALEDSSFGLHFSEGAADNDETLALIARALSRVSPGLHDQGQEELDNALYELVTPAAFPDNRYGNTRPTGIRATCRVLNRCLPHHLRASDDALRRLPGSGREA